MADYAGAVAAIKAKFAAEWVDGAEPRTRIAQVNENPADPWPPKDGDNVLQPWVLIAVECSGSHPHSFGSPGQNSWLYYGLIAIHVYVPVGQDIDQDALPLAVLAGEIFRNKLFYDDVTPGAYVRTGAPRVDGGGPGSDDGAWFRVTATTPFEFYQRA